MSAVLYGMAPFDGPRWPSPAFENPSTTGVLAPLPPESIEQIKARLEERVKWLERELKMHEAYKLELGVLQTTLTTLLAQQEDK